MTLLVPDSTAFVNIIASRTCQRRARFDLGVIGLREREPRFPTGILGCEHDHVAIERSIIRCTNGIYVHIIVKRCTLILNGRLSSARFVDD